MTHGAGVLVFGGTTEGRVLVEWLASRGSCDVTACSATTYGGSLIPAAPRVTSIARPLPKDQIEQLMARERFRCVVDATHPYATSITASVRGAAENTGTTYLRLVREDEPEGPWIGAKDAHDAARTANSLPGRVLLTTGSKDLDAFAEGIDDFSNRVYVRILPVVSSLERASALGVKTSHIIAMQGPFSEELNRAMIRELGIDVLVTKASGKSGGFEEKIAAATGCGCKLIVIHRPMHEKGVGLEQAKRTLVERFGV